MTFEGRIISKVIDEVYRVFVKEFRGKPLLVRSPGRVNLIGEHTDYNEGYVLPAAVDKSIIFAVAKRDGNLHRFYAQNLDDYFEFSGDGVSRSDRMWPNYLLGILDLFLKMGFPLTGVDCVFGGDIPIGAGMSSSAALECGFAFALNRLFRLGLDGMELVRLAQKSENEFVGVQCGIMDQFANIFGKRGHAIRLDCRSLDYEHVPVGNSDLRIVLCDTSVRRGLSFSEYNRRREQCREGVGVLQRHSERIKSLRDVSIEFLEQHRDTLEPVIYKRLRYVVMENDRVLSFCGALMDGNLALAGSLMFDSHEGLRGGYEVSCRELDILVEIAAGLDGVYGSRMMGAGFGGCTINLVRGEAVDSVTRALKKEYLRRTGLNAEVYVCRVEDGTSVLERP